MPPVRQQPLYPDAKLEAGVLSELAGKPGLVAINEIEALKASLAEVEKGKSFLLQGGDCAESFSAHSEFPLKRHYEF